MLEAKTSPPRVSNVSSNINKTNIPMNIRAITLGFLLSLIIPSCVVYHPQTTDIPLISEKNDLRIDAGISAIPSAHATISYGLTDKIAIQGFGSFGSFGDDNRYYFQATSGIYNNRGNGQVLELYGGFGYGHGDAQTPFRDPGILFGDYQLYFGQLNYGKIATEQSIFEMGFGIKTGYLSSHLTDENYYSHTSDTGPYETYHDKSLLFEPVGFVRIGGQKLKLSVKLGGALIYKFTNTDKHFPYSHINLGLGINYRL